MTRRISPSLYKWARRINTYEAWFSLNPHRIFRRYLNRWMGRLLMAAGLRKLWKMF